MFRDFFSSWNASRRFSRSPETWRRIVFYSESGQYWHHFRPIILELTDGLDRNVSYLTSDPHDPGLEAAEDRLRAYYIYPGLIRILLFQFMKADVVVLTMLDLNNFELKRSIHPAHYVYTFHGMGSTHMVDHANSYDHYDSIFCVGPHQMREIRRREEMACLPARYLVEHGYTRLETLMAEGREHVRETHDRPVILIAPTWGEESLLDCCGEGLVRVLLDAGYRVIVRPHYHTLKLTPEVIDRLVERFGENPRFTLITRMGESASLFESDLMICDWSSSAIEYALGLEKPVLYIDVPKRIRNPEFQAYGIEPIEIFIRERIGEVLSPQTLEEAPRTIERLLKAPDAFRRSIAALREEIVFNLGHSAPAAAKALAEIADDVGRK
ncbi:MAG: CDP-glycerol glycerophosphotransferase family protein [Pseudomonadota bacterium]|nr:CDP-glycerol glycerophosphotransferase family protein [Pseudomonadota bacterium]